LTYRLKTPVLCFYEHYTYRGGSTVRGTDAIAVEVEFSDQIIEAFEAAMKKKVARWREVSWGLPPFVWKLLRYQTPTGVANF